VRADALDANFAQLHEQVLQLLPVAVLPAIGHVDLLGRALDRLDGVGIGRRWSGARRRTSARVKDGAERDLVRLGQQPLVPGMSARARGGADEPETLQRRERNVERVLTSRRDRQLIGDALLRPTEHQQLEQLLRVAKEIGLHAALSEVEGLRASELIRANKAEASLGLSPSDAIESERAAAHILELALRRLREDHRVKPVLRRQPSLSKLGRTSSAHSSPRLFCSGVPVKSSRCAAPTPKSACEMFDLTVAVSSAPRRRPARRS